MDKLGSKKPIANPAMPHNLKFFSAIGLICCAALAGCASAPKIAPKEGFTLKPRIPAGAPVTIKEERRPSTLNDYGCNPMVVYKDSDFKPTYIDFLGKAIKAELEQLPESTATIQWLADKEVVLREFRASGGQECRSGAGFSNGVERHAAMAVVSPIGPLFGAMMDSLVDGAKSQEFVQLYAMISVDGREFWAVKSNRKLDMPALREDRQRGRRSLGPGIGNPPRDARDTGPARFARPVNARKAALQTVSPTSK